LPTQILSQKSSSSSTGASRTDPILIDWFFKICLLVVFFSSFEHLVLTKKFPNFN
jgi:hypothetical protein